jgi:hypothetical protein
MLPSGIQPTGSGEVSLVGLSVGSVHSGGTGIVVLPYRPVQPTESWEAAREVASLRIDRKITSSYSITRVIPAPTELASVERMIDR